MRLVLDSNVIFQDPCFRGKLLDCLKGLRELGDSVHVPKLVIEEVVRRHESALEELCRNLQKLLPAIQRVDPEFAEQTCSWSERNPRDSADRFRGELAGALEALGGEVLEYPTTPHCELVRRDLDRKRPFTFVGKRQKTTGYRDALIWESVVSLAQSHAERIAFVTEDKDFLSPNKNTTSDSLHPDLVGDLEQRGVDADGVVVFRGVDVLFDQYIRPSLDELSALRRKLESGEFEGFELQSWVREHLRGEVIVPAIDRDLFEEALAGGQPFSEAGIYFDLKRLPNGFALYVWRDSERTDLWDALSLLCPTPTPSFTFNQRDGTCTIECYRDKSLTELLDTEAFTWPSARIGSFDDYSIRDVRRLSSAEALIVLTMPAELDYASETVANHVPSLHGELEVCLVLNTESKMASLHRVKWAAE